ncbi:MAG TPA: hypothetical protein VHZ51_04940 [Ktedonobacteraceae bacterium]|nr:hypothetical protein [Ktedonobacteraceae bacterium]
MPSPEHTTQAANTFTEAPFVIDTFEDVTSNTDALVVFTQETDALARLPHIPDHRSMLSEKRRHILQQKQQPRTEQLPQLSSDTSGAKVAWRFVAQLRAENHRLRCTISDQEHALQRVTDEYGAVQTARDQEMAVVHTGYQQELASQQANFRELLDERNRLQEAYTRAEHNYQQLYHTFQDVVEEEAQKRVMEAVYVLESSPNHAVPPLLQHAVQILGDRAQQMAEKMLVDALFLKRKAQTLVEQLQAQHVELDEERQRLLAVQQTAREQSELRQQTARVRLKERWRVATLATSIGLLMLLVLLQFVFLTWLHVPLNGLLSAALLAPIVLCTALALCGSQPLTMVSDPTPKGGGLLRRPRC